jgi:hypothetical protein
MLSVKNKVITFVKVDLLIDVNHKLWRQVWDNLRTYDDTWFMVRDKIRDKVKWYRR